MMSIYFNFSWPFVYSNGSWCSVWNIEFKDEKQTVEVKGKMQVMLCRFFMHWCEWHDARLLNIIFFNPFSGWCPLFWGRKCAVRCKTWMQRCNSFSGYHRSALLRRYFYYVWMQWLSYMCMSFHIFFCNSMYLYPTSLRIFQ